MESKPNYSNNSEQSKSKKIIKAVYKYMQYILPVVLLIFVFSKVDINEVYNNLANTNIFLFIIGIVFFPIGIVIGGYRWYFLIRKTNKISFLFVLKNYWIGLGLGYFVPSFVGWDVYRVISVGKKTKNYLQQIILMVYERLTSLLSYGLVVIAFLPFIKTSSGINNESLTISIIIFTIISLLLLILFFYSLKSIFIKGIIKRLIDSTIKKVSTILKIKLTDSNLNQSNERVDSIKPNSLIGVLLLTLLIQTTTAIANHYLFLSIGVYVSLLYNLFATSMLTIIFILPISIGSIGVREISYVMVYGLFGVLPETAVSVSVIAFLGLVLNNSIGLIILFFDNLMKKKKGNQMSNDTELVNLSDKL